MTFQNGKKYTVSKLTSSHKYWSIVQEKIEEKTKKSWKQQNSNKSLILTELYDVRWVTKPFPFSWFKEFRPNRHFFYHGTTIPIIQKILNDGFVIQTSQQNIRSGRMLGNGIYATYHTHKGSSYAPSGYIISTMIYAPNTKVIGPGQTISSATINNAHNVYDAVEVRTGAIVNTWTMQNHEICVYNTQRIIPRFIIKVVAQ